MVWLDYRGQEARRVSAETPDPRETPGLLVRKVYKEMLALWGLKVIEGLLAQKGIPGPWDLPAQKEIKETLVKEGLRENKGLKENRVSREKWGHKALREKQVVPDRRENKGPSVLSDPREKKATLDPKENAGRPQPLKSEPLPPEIRQRSLQMQPKLVFLWISSYRPAPRENRVFRVKPVPKAPREKKAIPGPKENAGRPQPLKSEPLPQEIRQRSLQMQPKLVFLWISSYRLAPRENRVFRERPVPKALREKKAIPGLKEKGRHWAPRRTRGNPNR